MKKKKYKNKSREELIEENRYLQKYHDRYIRLIENTRDMIYRMSLPDGKYEYVSPACKEIFGYEPKMFLETPVLIRELIHPDFVKYFQDEWQKLLDGKLSPTYEYKIIHKSGEERWLNQRNFLIEDENGNLIAMEGIITDITKQKKAEESDQLKSSFLANMSHEVRTPMNGIIGFSQFLKDPELSHEDKMRYITIINESCQQLLGIVEDILEISKLETGQIEIMNEEFNPEEIANTIVINHEDICKQKGLEFTYHKEITDNKLLLADKIKLTQILKNLLSNAIKFTHEGKIELGFTEKKEYAEFYVKDTGIGIEPGFKDNIFDRFRQAETAMARTYGGTGLGLAIAKGYVELMNGEIRVESEKDKGSTFFVKIPYQKLKSIKTQPEIVTSQEPMISFNKAKVLIAEDEEINYQYIKRVFNDLGIENLERAHNGKEAIEIMEEKGDVSLIMMDLKMPIVNGFEATQKIKSMNAKVPIIAQTALAIPGDKQKALDAGCDDYIAKPIDYDTLLGLIEKYITTNE